MVLAKHMALTASTTRAADATQYTAGDAIGSTLTFTLPAGFKRGRVLALGLTITPATSNLVITALDGIAWMWTGSEVPTFVADNAVWSLTAANHRATRARFNFANGAWTNPLGALTASTHGFQHMLPVNHSVAGAPFSFEDLSLALTASRTLVIGLQATAAWNPTSVANTIAAHLDIEADF